MNILRAIMLSAFALLTSMSSAGAEEMELRLQLERPSRNTYIEGKSIHHCSWLTITAREQSEVIIQENEQRCRIHIITGSVSIRNDQERSVIKTAQGTIYESILKPQTIKSSAFVDRAASPDKLAIFETALSQTFLLPLAGPKKPQISAEIISPPTRKTYLVGAAALPNLPQNLLTHFPPEGLMKAPAPTLARAPQAGP